MHSGPLSPRPWRGQHRVALVFGLLGCLAGSFLLASRLSIWRGEPSMEPAELGWMDRRGNLVGKGEAGDASSHLHPQNTHTELDSQRLVGGEQALPHAAQTKLQQTEQGLASARFPPSATGQGAPMARQEAAVLQLTVPRTPRVAPPGARVADTLGAAAGAKPSPSPAASPASQGQPRAVGLIWDKRVSGLGPKLDQATLHGGWQLTRDVFDRAMRHPNATMLSLHSPRLLLVRGFLSQQEVEYLVTLAEGDLARSMVVADGMMQQPVRTSDGSWLNGPKRDVKVLEIQNRIHNLIGIPEEFGESIYVLRYNIGEKYEAHNDHCSLQRGLPGSESCRTFVVRGGGPHCGPGAGGITCGDRLATFIMYLRSPVKGGETVFPMAQPAHLATAAGTKGLPFHPRKEDAAAAAACGGAGSRAQQAAGPPDEHGADVAFGGGDFYDLTPTQRMASVRWERGEEQRESQAGVAPTPAPTYCDERAGRLRVSPQPGDAVLFWNYAPMPAEVLSEKGSPEDVLSVQPDVTSLHGGCPVVEGTKFIATRWIRSAVFS